MSERSGETLPQDRIDAEVHARLSKMLEVLRHELRTPIGSIITLTDILENQKDDSGANANQADYMDAIRQSAETALNILQSIASTSEAMDLASLTDAPIVHKTFNLRAFLKSIEHHHKAKAVSKGLAFHIKHGEDLPERITAPMTAWRQILDNLLNNAIKFTRNGAVGFSAVMEDGVIAFHVQDTGPGLATAGGESLFEPYVRGSNAGTNRGHGLGLAIVKTLTQRCEGALSFKSGEGAGTHFYLRMPYETAADMAVRDSARKARTAGQVRPPQGRNILVVEDNPINRMLIETLLDKFGHTVTQVENGQAALKIAKKKVFDLVLMDIEIPGGMDGFETSLAIRKLSNWQGVPILALSAHDGPHIEEKIGTYKLDGFIAKPLSARALYTAIETACQEKVAKTAT